MTDATATATQALPPGALDEEALDEWYYSLTDYLTNEEHGGNEEEAVIPRVWDEALNDYVYDATEWIASFGKAFGHMHRFFSGALADKFPNGAPPYPVEDCSFWHWEWALGDFIEPSENRHGKPSLFQTDSHDALMLEAAPQWANEMSYTARLQLCREVYLNCLEAKLARLGGPDNNDLLATLKAERATVDIAEATSLAAAGPAPTPVDAEQLSSLVEASAAQLDALAEANVTAAVGAAK